MPRYLVSFDDGAMDHIAEQDLPAVSAASREVVQAAKDAGVWIFGGGLQRQRGSVVQPDGTVADGPQPGTRPVVGGFSVLEVGSHAEALQWAARLAASCRCAQQVREIMYDPES